MKLVSSNNDNSNDTIDLMDLIAELEEKHRTVYWFHKDSQIYIYKPLGRRDYKELCFDEEMDDIEKEDEVCRRCLLFPNPRDIDFDNCEAGLISSIFKKIMFNSYLEDVNQRIAIMDASREQMQDIDNQIPCIINEAFPQFDIEEIENWGVERTAKYLSRAEWKLQNFRGAVFNYAMPEQGVQPQENEQPQPQQQQKIESDKMSKSNNNSNKKRLDPAELARLKAIAPEIDWEKDTVLTEGMDGMSDGVDTVAPALRPGFF